MRQQTLFQNAAGLEANIDRMLARLEKGYPEYRSDQPRGGDGRWSGGGGASISEGRAKGSGTRARGATPKSPRKSPSKRAKPVADKLDAIKRDAESLKSASEAARKEASDRMARNAEDAWDTIRNYDSKVWYEPGFADEVHDMLVGITQDVLFWVSGLASGGLTFSIWGAAFTVNALYLMGRWVGRKIVTGGRYAGVR